MRTLSEKRQQLTAYAEARKAENEAMNQKYRDLFSTDLGRDVMGDLLAKFPASRRCFKFNDARPIDPFEAAVHDGESAVTNYIQTRINNAQ